MTPPWHVAETSGSYLVTDSAGHQLAHVYFKEEWQVEMMPNYLTKDEARRVAGAIARLPELLKPKRGEKP